MTADDRRRVDKWLWFARVTKTRTGAQKLVTGGKVRINRDRIDSASRVVRVDDVLTITLEAGIRVLKIAGLGERRGPAPEARRLYEDLSPPPPPRGSTERGRVGARPTKRDRRALQDLRNRQSEDDLPEGDV